MTSQIFLSPNGKMILLGIDTCTSIGNLSLVKTGETPEVLITKNWSKKSTHSDVVTIELEASLKDAGLTFKDLDGLVVGVGPGSFTGIRVGVNLIRTLGYSLNIPVWGISSLEALALPALEKSAKVLCALRAFRNLVYIASYEKSKNGLPQVILPPQAITFEKLNGLIDQKIQFAGNAYELIIAQCPELKSKLLFSHELAPTPQAISLCTLVSLSSLPSNSWNEVKPFYIRASEAEEKLKAGILKPI